MAYVGHLIPYRFHTYIKYMISKLSLKRASLNKPHALATQPFKVFSKVFNALHKEKMERIQQVTQ